MLIDILGLISTCTLKIIVSRVFGFEIKDDYLSDSFYDIFKEKSKNFFSSRVAARELERVADSICEKLNSVYEYSRLPNRTKEMVAERIKDLLASKKIDRDFLEQNLYNAAFIEDRILFEMKSELQTFSDEEKKLFITSLQIVINYIVISAKKSSHFSIFGFSYLIDHAEEVSSHLEEILRKIDILIIKEKDGSGFALQYLSAIKHKYSFINIFGASFPRSMKKYPLDLAYVMLDIYRGEGDSSAHTHETYFKYSILDIFTANDNNIIIGEAGTGKSTLAQWLLLNIPHLDADTEEPIWDSKIPFLVELKGCYDQLPTINEIVKYSVPSVYDSMPQNWMSKVLEENKAVLIIDGFDEVPLNKRNSVIEWIVSMKANHKLSILLFSRPAAKEWVELESEGFATYKLSPMDQGTIDIFIENWHNAVLHNQGEEYFRDYFNNDNISNMEDAKKIIVSRLKKRIKENNALKKLAAYPLLCAMICGLHLENKSKLPNDRNALYEECCLMLLERRDTQRDIDFAIGKKLNYQQKKSILCDIAYWMQINGYTRAPMRNILARITTKLENMDEEIRVIEPLQILGYLVERCGILRSIGNEVDFLHRTFQEYLSAYIFCRDSYWGVLYEHALDDTWHETIILAVGFDFAKTTEITAFVQSFMDSGDKTGNSIYYMLAILCQQNAAEIDKTIRSEVIAKLDSIVPPKTQNDIEALVSAGELSLPLLTNNEVYSDNQRKQCIRALSQIHNGQTLEIMNSYITAAMTEDLFDVFVDSLGGFYIKDIINGYLLPRIFELVQKYKNTKGITINCRGYLGEIFINTPERSIKNYFNSKLVRRVHSNYSNMVFLQLMDIFENTTHVTIYDRLVSLEDLNYCCNFARIIAIKIVNENEVWPTIEGLSVYSSLQNVILELRNGHFLHNKLVLHPLIRNKTLKRLTIHSCTELAITQKEIEAVNRITTLRFLRLSSTHGLEAPFRGFNQNPFLEYLILEGEISVENIMELKKLCMLNLKYLVVCDATSSHPKGRFEIKRGTDLSYNLIVR